MDVYIEELRVRKFSRASALRYLGSDGMRMDLSNYMQFHCSVKFLVTISRVETEKP